MGWSRHRRIVILRRRIERSLIVERNPAGQSPLGFAEIDGGREFWEYVVLVTSLASEVLTIGRLYRDLPCPCNGINLLDANAP